MIDRLIGLDAIFGDGEERERPDLARLMELRRRGACSTMAPALFFPERGQSAVRAKVACRSCPVRAECLAYAVEHREWWGVWGGTTEKERRPLNLLHGQGVALDVVIAKALAGDLDDEMAERRITGRRQRRAMPRSAPYGWKLDRGEVVTDPAEQAVLGRLRGWARAGVSPAESADRLNAESIRTRRGEAWLPVKVVRVLTARMPPLEQAS